MMILLKIVAFLLGLLMVWVTVGSAIKTFVVPRTVRDPIVRPWFRLLRRLFDLRMRWLHSYEERDRVMAYYAPVALVSTLHFPATPITLHARNLMRFAHNWRRNMSSSKLIWNKLGWILPAGVSTMTKFSSISAR